MTDDDARRRWNWRRRGAVFGGEGREDGFEMKAGGRRCCDDVRRVVVGRASSKKDRDDDAFLVCALLVCLALCLCEVCVWWWGETTDKGGQAGRQKDAMTMSSLIWLRRKHNIWTK